MIFIYILRKYFLNLLPIMSHFRLFIALIFAGCLFSACSESDETPKFEDEGDMPSPMRFLKV